MASIKNNANNTSVVIKPEDRLIEAGEKIGIPFGCTEGNCGTCLVRIVKGQAGLNKYSDKEEAFGLEEDERLTCQMRVLHGDVLVEV